jgi:hypothetical protein
MLDKKRPQQPGTNPVKKPGRPPTVPTAGERELVTLAVAIGMTVDQVSAAIGMPRRTVYRVFRQELAIGRAKRLLASAARLDAMAEAGNVSAAKYLHTLMVEGGQRQDTFDDDDPWAAVAAEIAESTDDGPGNLAQFQDFGKAS